ncbi:hypothetical protein AVEN_185673-1 [Araneus ventricosus]|uniref:Uncharacterized protein n=1 Tax=Araneus ventricosus TaxID=182803 RepID=A0A4Y2JE29_ARAVE|nr:hypothetical protein AVEN_185673-1 [Araneus ventricosus]
MSLSSRHPDEKLTEYIRDAIERAIQVRDTSPATIMDIQTAMDATGIMKKREFVPQKSTLPNLDQNLTEIGVFWYQAKCSVEAISPAAFSRGFIQVVLSHVREDPLLAAREL